MYKKKFGLIILAVILSGCASQMPESHYTNLASFAGMIERCYEAGYVDANLHSQSLAAYQVVLNTWSYDQQKLRSHVARSYSTSSPSYGSCNAAKGHAHKMIADARQYQASQQAASQSIYQAQQNSNALYQQSVRSLNQQLMQLPDPNAGFSTGSGFTPQTFYPANSCFGTFVNGKCQGTINPSVTPKCCHGTFINGECKGTVVNGPC